MILRNVLKIVISFLDIIEKPFKGLIQSIRRRSTAAWITDADVKKIHKWGTENPILIKTRWSADSFS